VDLKETHCEAHGIVGIKAGIAHVTDEAHSILQGILAKRPRRCPRVRVLAKNFDGEFSHSLNRRYRADRNTSTLEHLPLLDMNFDKGVHGAPELAHSNPGQCLGMSGNSLFKSDASPIPEGERHLKGASVGESGGPDGADREAGTAFFPGPDDSGHGSARLKASVVNGFERLEGSEYTVHPVEPTSIWLAVSMGANQDGSRVGLSAGTCDE
jgi:hypothetical protein